MPTPWRYIPPISADGTTQMAIDRWLFSQHQQGLQPPSLRFYTWEPAALSLGYHQRTYPEHWQHLVWEGQPIGLVSRPTGGRAVLHQGDLTYAVITTATATDRRRSYEQLCQFLIQGWQVLGVPLQFGAAGRGYINNPNCFGTATAADLVTADGAKLIGSAQLRQDTSILQHGSMRLHQDPVLFEQVFQIADRAIPNISNSADQIIATLYQAAEQCFDAVMTIAPLTTAEMTAIQAFSQ
jgi:lipoate---protein ligase